jgi:hypothetical protein
VERGGGDDDESGDILSLERSGMMVCGRGIMVRRGRIGAAERAVLAGGVLAGALGGGITEISSSLLTSSTKLSRVTKFGVLMAMTSSTCSLPVLLAGPLWPTWLSEFWNSWSMALNLSQFARDLVMVSIWSPPLPWPTLPLLAPHEVRDELPGDPPWAQ